MAQFRCRRVIAALPEPNQPTNSRPDWRESALDRMGRRQSCRPLVGRPRRSQPRGLLAVGTTVVETDPDRARACLRESLALSTALGYQGALDLVWAAGLAFFVNDRTATLELGRRAIRALQPGGDRLLMGWVLQVIAGALAATKPEAAAMIQGAAKASVAESPTIARPFSLIVTEALGGERARELRARGVDMDWDQAVAYTLAQTAQALDELQSQTQP
jgi:hypothetical protein